jgi:hypothetical protein
MPLDIRPIICCSQLLYAVLASDAACFLWRTNIYETFLRIHPPASRRAESVRPQSPFLRQPPNTTRSPLARDAEISRCFLGL